MGRPPLDRGTYGEIRVRSVGDRFEARCIYRAWNGATSEPSARGDTDAAARRALRKKLANYKAKNTKGQINRDTKFRDAAAAMLDTVRQKAIEGSGSFNTTKAYEGSVKLVNTYMGDLRLWEFEEAVDVVNDTVQDIKESQSYESAKKARTVISLVAQLAIRRRAISSNPIRSIESLTRPKARTTGEDDGTPAMTETHIQDLLHGLDRFCADKVATPMNHGRRLGKRGAVWEDLPELAEASLATGTRFGETLALTGDNVVPYVDESTGRERVAVLVDAHLVRVPAKDRGPGEDGIQRKPGRKGGRPGIFLRVPEWSEAMFLRRKAKAGAGPLFPSFGGGWLDQINANHRLREALDGAGFAWVTSRVWRKTLGTLMRSAGRSSEDIAEQLGNTRAVAERHYMARPKLIEFGAEVLETIKPRRAGQEFSGGKSADERNEGANDNDGNAFRPGAGVGAAGIEPATARGSNDHLPKPTHPH